MEGEEGMNKGLMYGLIGIGVAIVVGAIFIFLAIAGPKLSTGSSKADLTELQTNIDNLQSQLEASKAALVEAQSEAITKDKEISTLQKQVNDLKAKPKETPAPVTPENPTNITPYNETPKLNIDDISTLTKQNCNEAINLSRTNESAARNYTKNLSAELDVLRLLRINITDELANSTGNLTQSRKDQLEDDFADVEDDIDDKNDAIDAADERQDAAEARRKRVVYQCNKLLAA